MAQVNRLNNALNILLSTSTENPKELETDYREEIDSLVELCEIGDQFLDSGKLPRSIDLLLYLAEIGYGELDDEDKAKLKGAFADAQKICKEFISVVEKNTNV